MTSVLMICGSLRSASTNLALLKLAAALAPAGWHCNRYGEMAMLPHFNPDDDNDPAVGFVGDLRAGVAAADVVLLSTPEYAGGLPGSFKNLLDWTIGGNEIGGKPVAWINASTWPTGAAEAHASVRRFLGYAGADIIEPACVHIPVQRQEIDVYGEIASPAIRRAITELWGAVDDHLKAAARRTPA